LDGKVVVLAEGELVNEPWLCDWSPFFCDVQVIYQTLAQLELWEDYKNTKWCLCIAKHLDESSDVTLSKAVWS
jgi:hypothetical protein